MGKKLFYFVLHSRSNGESNGHAISSPRFSSFRPVSEQSTKSMLINGSMEENVNKPLSNGQSSISNLMDIKEHEAFVKNKTYSIYLSNLEVTEHRPLQQH